MFRTIKLILLGIIAVLLLILLGTEIQERRTDFRNKQIHEQAVAEYFSSPKQKKIYKAKQKALNKRRDLQDRINSTVTVSTLGALNKGTALWFNKTPWKKEVAAATKDWNKVGLGVRFEQTFDKNKAELFFITDNKILNHFAKGFGLGMMASNGNSNYAPGVIILNSNKRDPLVSYTMPKTAQHEIGHYLGLEHNNQNSCSIMYQGELCADTSSCGLDEFDKARLRELYSKRSTRFNFSILKCRK